MIVLASIDASDGLIPQLVYGQTERAGQALGGFLSFLSMYLIRSHLLVYGETVADRNTYDDTIID